MSKKSVSKELVKEGMSAIKDTGMVRKAFLTGELCNYSARTYVGIENVGCRRAENVLKSEHPNVKRPTWRPK